MQFIDFKKEHFSQDEKEENYFIEISKDEIGYGDIEVLEKRDDQIYAKTDYEIIDDVTKVTIKMKNPVDIRLNF
jgi:hypothetical protein